MFAMKSGYVVQIKPIAFCIAILNHTSLTYLLINIAEIYLP